MSKLKTILVEASMRNRMDDITWNDVKNLLINATPSNKQVLLLAINNKNYVAIGRELFDMLHKQVREQVEMQVNQAINVGSVTVEQLQDIFV